MTESVNIDRQPGEPLKFTIDLKWSLWSKDPETFATHAPQTLAHLRAGFEGAFEEYGDTLEIYTAPRKEYRYGSVTIEPKLDRVTVVFRDYDPYKTVVRMFALPQTLAQFLQAVDAIEEEVL